MRTDRLSPLALWQQCKTRFGRSERR